MTFPWLREKKLRMVWQLEKAGQVSFLVGTAHFSPYRFERALTLLLQRVDTVFFEGPLDDETLTWSRSTVEMGKGALP